MLSARADEASAVWPRLGVLGMPWSRPINDRKKPHHGFIDVRFRCAQMRTKTGDHRMSDTDRTGASSPAGGAKSTPRRGRAASRVASGRPAEDASSAPRQPEATAPDSAGDPGGSDASAIAAGAPEREIAPVSPCGPDRASRDALSDGVATPIGHEEATPSPEAAPPPEPDAPSPPAEEIAPSPWRHMATRRPLPPRRHPAQGRRPSPLALAALLLSLGLPGALFLRPYLAASGVFDRLPERLAPVESAVEALRATAAAKPEVVRGPMSTSSPQG